MSLFSWLTKDREQTFVVIDIGSSSVGAGLAVVRGDKAPELAVSARHDLRLHENLTFKDLLGETERALKASLSDLAKKSVGRPKAKKYICFLSSPYYLAKTANIRHSENGKFIFTKNILEQLSGDEAEEFAATEPLLYPEIIGDRNVVIEKKISKIKLNGYESRRPFGQEAQVAEITQYMSIGSLSVLERLEEVIISATHRGEIEFHSYPFALCDAFHQSLGTDKSFAVIDVSGELSDIVFSSHGSLSQNVTVPFGRNTLLRRLARATGYMFEELPGLLALYQRDQLSPQAKKRLESALRRATGEWTALLEQAFVVAAKQGGLPGLVYMIGEDSADGLFTKALGETDISGHFRGDLVVRSADRDLFAKHGDGDIFLVLESVFCGRMV